MSGLINPHAAPEEAAYALLIELVRAQRVPQYEAKFPACWRCTTKLLNTLKRKRPSVRRGHRGARKA